MAKKTFELTAVIKKIEVSGNGHKMAFEKLKVPDGIMGKLEEVVKLKEPVKITIEPIQQTIDG